MRNFLIILFASLSLNVFASVQANFSADKYSGCSPLVVTFSNTSQPSNLTWFWDFGNGNTSTLANPSAVFNVSGVYNVKLVASNGSQKDSITKTITVFRVPQVDFHAIKTDVCQGDSLKLVNDVTAGDAAITNYGWGFGDNIASSIPNPSHVYTSIGTYTITLVVQDANSCSANNSKTAYIQVLPSPTVSFTASPAASCNASQQIAFNNTSPDAGLTYLWNLHDGITATTTNVSHTYSQEKRYVTLTGTNSNGCSSSAVQRISVGQVIANFTSKTEACTGEQIQFTNTSNVLENSVWDFGDGTGSNALSPVKVYANPGTYTVTLTQIDGPCSNTIVKTNHIVVTQGFSVTFAADNSSSGCSDTGTVVNFTANAPQGVTFDWNFGDQSMGSGANPSHNFTSNGNFYVTLTVTDANGCVVKATQMTQISLAPIDPAFRGDTVSCPGGAVHFHNVFSWNISHKWDFGDGTSFIGSNPTHAYSSPGTYTVTLTATNFAGCSATTTKLNYVRVEEIVTDFSVNETFSPCPPFVTIFKSTASRKDLAYRWEFGDGTTDTSANPTHIYFYPGIFTVKMITTSSNGCIDTVVYPDLIEVQGPTGSFSAQPSSGCIPLTVSFQSTVSANTKSMWCDLGDGTLIVDSLQFQHIYSQVNTFNPKFVVVDHVGCAVPYDLPPIVTHELPSLQLRDTLVCQGETVSVSLGSESYSWTPSAYVSCDTCADVLIVPQATTQYTIEATNQFGCKISQLMTVNVDSLPVLNSPDTIKVCKNSSVELFAGNAYSIQWSPALFLDDSTSLHPVCTPLQSIVYEVRAANSLGCASVTTVPVKVIEKIELADMSDMTVCAFDPFQLNPVLEVSPDAEMKYIWTPASFQIASNISNPIIPSLNKTTVFQVIASSGTCISDTASVTVQVLKLPVMEVSEGVTTTPLAEVPLFASSREDLTYQWTSADELSCADCRLTSAYPSQSQFIYVTGTNSNGCKTTDSVLIKVVPCDPNAVFLPNIFTPNNDGINDKFLLRSKVLTSLSYFRVFNQWGELVFESKNINDGWDGTIKGQPAPVAVYACSLGGKCDNGFDVTKSSNITLIR